MDLQVEDVSCTTVKIQNLLKALDIYSRIYHDLFSFEKCWYQCHHLLNGCCSMEKWKAHSDVSFASMSTANTINV